MKGRHNGRRGLALVTQSWVPEELFNSAVVTVTALVCLRPLLIGRPRGAGPTGHKGIVSAVKMTNEEWLIMRLHPVHLTGSVFKFPTQQMFARHLHAVCIHCYANLAVFPFNLAWSH